MPNSISVTFGAGVWPDIARPSQFVSNDPRVAQHIELSADGPRVLHVGEGAELQVNVLESGMAGGHPSVALRVRLPDGQIAVIETTARLLCLVASQILDRFPNLMDQASETMAATILHGSEGGGDGAA